MDLVQRSTERTARVRTARSTDQVLELMPERVVVARSPRGKVFVVVRIVNRSRDESVRIGDLKLAKGKGRRVYQYYFEGKKVISPGGSLRLCLTIQTDKVPKGRGYEVELDVIGRLGSSGTGEEVRARFLLQVDPG